jgi:glutaminyl-tRNA synthetase
VESSLGGALPGDRFQFERTGYFIADSEDHSTENLVFNRIVPLRDSWKKIEAKEKKGNR